MTGDFQQLNPVAGFHFENLTTGAWLLFHQHFQLGILWRTRKSKICGRITRDRQHCDLARHKSNAMPSLCTVRHQIERAYSARLFTNPRNYQ
jgi:hypothetical protein